MPINRSNMVHQIMECVPVDSCRLVKCEKCGKATWAVSICCLFLLLPPIRAASSEYE
ncbi:hypothetical protein ARMGADRAFT_12868 [Armillaria gallica]|uniref:Uncharacterized protein n=1 Tax=Armillaria gallica TaxID=47427 RepID=A0A2H3E7G0_ARMGA|nr:hypothetical protein ARMGADRAFT_12868 [Armillaria gallica]